jgi:hypothetical protein
MQHDGHHGQHAHHGAARTNFHEVPAGAPGGRTVPSLGRTAVADESTATIGEVRERLNALYLTYLGAARWLAEVQDKESDILIGPRLERLKDWQRAHRKWHDRMKDLDTVPAHRQTLRIYLTPSPEPHRDRLIREAESD